MSDKITMRVWTNMGKEHIYHINYFRSHSSSLEINSDDLDSILHIVEAGNPCNISFITHSSGNKTESCSEHSFHGCTVVKGSIHFQALCVPSD